MSDWMRPMTQDELAKEAYEHDASVQHDYLWELRREHEDHYAAEDYWQGVQDAADADADLEPEPEDDKRSTIMLTISPSLIEIKRDIDAGYALRGEVVEDYVAEVIIVRAGEDQMTVDRLHAIFDRMFNRLRKAAKTQDAVQELALWVKACHGIPAQERYLEALRADWMRLVPCGRCGGSGNYTEAGHAHGKCYRCQGRGIDNPNSNYPALH